MKEIPVTYAATTSWLNLSKRSPELPVTASQLCRDFFKRFICTDKYGCVRKHTENAAHKNTPLFLKDNSVVQ